MAWIKRNLIFVILSVICLLLIGVGVFYLITQVNNESTVASGIADKYQQLTDLNKQDPHPGNDTIDNIKNAKAQEASQKAYFAKLTPLFQRIPGIPDTFGTTNKVSNSEFAAELRNTISELRKHATNQGVTLPDNYYFSFEAERKVMIFDSAGLDKLAVQLGEVKALCEILFDGKVVGVDSIRREAVSANDNNPSDYLTDKTTITPLFELSPYELTFRCFSAELASVMSHLSGSPQGFVVKTIAVEPTTGGADFASNDPNSQQFNPNGPGPQLPFGPGGPRPPGFNPPPRAVVPTFSKGSQIYISEKQFRVTLMVEVVKLKPVVK